MPLANDLFNQMIQTHVSTAETNRLLISLSVKMNMFFVSDTAYNLKQKGGVWETYISQARVPAANIRIATFDLDSIARLDGAPIYQQMTESDPRLRGDGGGSIEKSAAPPAINFYPTIRNDLVAYLRRLLTAELAAVVATSKNAVGKYGNHRAIVSLDYYSDRPTDTNGLHKDTTGTTLFVALHYINPGPMLGPEYIHDKWPIKSRPGYRQNFTEMNHGGDSKARWHAPWTKDDSHPGHYYWPRRLLNRLEKAREQSADDKKLHHVNLSPYGLVSFVDELIYHATPLCQTRTEKQKQTLFQTVNVSCLDFEILPPVLQRSVSQSFINGENVPSFTGGASKRQFVRLWISVVPTNWYKPLII